MDTYRFHEKSVKKIFFDIQNVDGSITQFNFAISKLDGKQARLAFQAPDNVNIIRGELLEDTVN